MKIRKIVSSNIARNITYFIFCIVLICLLRNRISEDAIVTIIVGIMALFGVYLQLSENHKISSASFDLDLQNSFTNSEGFGEIYMYCWEKLAEKSNQKQKLKKIKDIRVKLSNYLTFFESVYLMKKRGVISIDLLDELFGSRFFVVVTCREVQDLDLVRNWKYYTNVYRLYCDWVFYKKQQNKNKGKKNIKEIYDFAERDLIVALRESNDKEDVKKFIEKELKKKHMYTEYLT